MDIGPFNLHSAQRKYQFRTRRTQRVVDAPLVWLTSTWADSLKTASWKPARLRAGEDSWSTGQGVVSD